MKKIVFLLVLVIAISCKSEKKEALNAKEVKVEKKDNFPKELGKVFSKHGGIKAWRNAQILSFNKGEEVHTVDLKSRKTVINSPKYSLGFDGKEVWLHQEEKDAYKGNPEFYYNLYFYFYAMPFVLADDGIIYQKLEKPISYKGINYPGYKISYKANVGTSPDDNYIIYYHPETFQMEWLAYTVTYRSKKASDNFKFIQYNNWQNVNGLLLPKEITWFKKDENGNPTEPARPATVFTLPLISQGKLADSFFKKPVVE